MPRNKHYIGDPCYVLSDKNMEALIEAIGAGAKGLLIDDHKIYFAYTECGDGEYSLKDFHGTIAHLGVDSGCLALIPNDLLAAPVNETEDDRGTTNRHLGYVCRISGEFREKDGFFAFGDGLYIDTR